MASKEAGDPRHLGQRLSLLPESFGTPVPHARTALFVCSGFVVVTSLFGDTGRRNLGGSGRSGGRGWGISRRQCQKAAESSSWRFWHP
jgi:hypothetical protein